MYDSAKDKTIKEITVPLSENTSVVVGVYQYDNGPEKIGISSAYVDRNGDVKVGKLKRFPVEHGEKIAEAIQTLCS